MKKILLIASMIFALIISASHVKSQSANPKEYNMIGKSITSYDEIGTEFRPYDTQRAKISLYIGNEFNKFVLIRDDIYIMGFYKVTYFTSKDKEIKPEDVDKMIEKNKLDHYVFVSEFSSNDNLYKFNVPYDKKHVEFIETEDNRNYKYSFDVVDVKFVAPELPTMNKINR